jgi:hypothetical protein
MNTIAKLLCCSLLLTGFETCLGQEISVRVLDAKSGRGIKNQEVWAQFYEPPSNRTLRRVSATTGEDGIALIQLPQSQPRQLFLSVSDDSFRCKGSLQAATEDILSRGATNRANEGDCTPKNSSHASNPKPGEVVIFVRRMPWWARLLAPLERE